jgi:DHA2 family multidrug resistance protein-like MFS transporter
MVVLAMIISTIMTMMDQTIANTALPTIARDVQATAASSIWIINAFQFALTIAIVPIAAAGDSIGYARVYRAGVILFVLASLGCVIAHSLTLLVAARFVQGLAGAAISCTTGPLLRRAFPPEMLGRATGFAAMSVALGSAAGPVVSGIVLSVASWQWLFAINIPLGLGSLVLTQLFVRHVDGTGVPYDWTSAAMSVTTFSLAVLGFDSVSHQGPAVITALEIVAAVVVGTVFIRRQLALPLPMFPVDLFRRSPFTLAVVSCYGSFVAQMIAFIALPFLFQTIMGRSPLEVGLLLLPWLLAAACMAPVAGRLADRFNSSRLAAAGMAIFAIGLLLAERLPVHAASWDIVWRMLICGTGWGLFQSPNNRSIQSSAPRERAGAPQAMQNTARLVGQTTGAALVGFVFSSIETSAHGAATVSPSAIALTLGIATGVAVLASAASVWRGTITGSIRLVRAPN